MDNLTVVVPFRNGHATIGRLLDSLPNDLPVLIVDDQSREPLQLDPFAQFRSGRGSTVVLRPEARGYFSGAVNVGLQKTFGDVLVINQDVWLEGTAWLDLIAENRGRYALIGDGVMGHPAWPNGYVQGTFMWLRRDAVDRVGLLNDADYPLWGSTAEYQLRLCRLGFEALPTRVPGLKHARQGSFGGAIKEALVDEPEKQSLFIHTPPEISVVITCHNYGRFLEDAVHSLVGGPTAMGDWQPQTFQSFEIVIVDDASTDNTAEIGRALADPWRAIRYLRMPELGGSAAAMNAGIRVAYGKAVAPLDADDMMESARLEVLWRRLQKNPHSVIYDDPMWVIDNQRDSAYPLPEYDFDLVLNKNPMHKGILFPRQAWLDTGGYPEVMNQGREDWAFNIALGLKGYCGIHVPQALYLYRRHNDNRSLTNGTEEWRRRFFRQLYSLYPNLYAGERPMGCCGGGRSKMAQQASGRPVGAFAAAVGSNGMIMLEYLANRAGTMPFYGVKTKTRYLFGGQRKMGWVDARDVDGFLQILDGKQPAFRVLEAAPAKAAAPKVPATESKVAAALEAPVAGPAQAADESTAEADVPGKPESSGEAPAEKPKRTRKKKDVDAAA